MKKNGPKALSQIIMLRRKEQAAGFACLLFFFLFLHCVVNISLFSNKKTVLSALLDPPRLSMAILSSGSSKSGPAASAESWPSRAPVLRQSRLVLPVGRAPEPPWPWKPWSCSSPLHGPAAAATLLPPHLRCTQLNTDLFSEPPILAAQEAPFPTNYLNLSFTLPAFFDHSIVLNPSMQNPV